MKMIDPADYQPDLQKRFEQLRPRLLAWLGSAVSIEHIGASSIPGAVSKGDLDICVIVARGELEEVVSKLVARGYAVKQDTLRTGSLCMLESAADEPEHALQIVADGSEFMDFMRFRDQLRADPFLVAAYNEIKRAAAGLTMDEYRVRKSSFIETVLSSLPSPSMLADYFCKGLETASLSPDEARAWADREIASADTPDYSFIAISLSTSPDELISELASLASRQVHTSVGPWLLARLRHVDVQSVEALDRAIRKAMLICRHCKMGDEPYYEFDGLDDSLFLARHDKYGSVDEIKGAFLECVTRYAREPPAI